MDTLSRGVENHGNRASSSVRSDVVLRLHGHRGDRRVRAGTLFDKVAKLSPFKWALMYASLAVGVFLAYYYKLDVVNVGLGLPYSQSASF